MNAAFSRARVASTCLGLRGHSGPTLARADLVLGGFRFVDDPVLNSELRDLIFRGRGGEPPDDFVVPVQSQKRVVI